MCLKKVLGIEPRALSMFGKHLAMEPYSQPVSELGVGNLYSSVELVFVVVAFFFLTLNSHLSTRSCFANYKFSRIVTVKTAKYS